ncbi:MAG TPA: hypothetical protein VF220_10120 [Nitrososphaeraceae archaeon]
MNLMWKCPHCTQTSNRGWNIQAHVLRKHNGFGTPIDLMDNPVQLRIMIMELEPHRPSRIEHEIQPLKRHSNRMKKS